MKLKEAMEMAAACGLRTLGEAVDNVIIHSGNFFVYEQAHAEVNALLDEAKETHGKDWANVLIPQEIIDEEIRKMDEYFESVQDLGLPEQIK